MCWLRWTGMRQRLFDAPLLFQLRCPALFYDFQQIGLNEKLRYKTSGDLHQRARFYWDVVSAYVQDALCYLRVTQDGKQ